MSEVLMSLGHQLLGWQALIWWRFIFGLLLLLVFVGTLARRNGLPAVAVTAGTAAFVLVPSIQERPALVGLIFIALTGATCARILIDARFERSTWLWVPATFLWANLHGSWILAPGALALALTLSAIRLKNLSYIIQSSFLLISVAIAGCLSPIGWNGFLLPFKLRDTAGRFIVEWQRTDFTDPLAYGLLALLILFVVASTLGKARPNIFEFLWVLIWTLFAFTAFRNIGPATLLIAPLVARRLDRWISAFPKLMSQDMSRATTAKFKFAMALALLCTVISTALVNPLDGVKPQYIAKRLAASTQNLRIINDYNASGVLLALGGDRVHLAVDGRADRFNPDWLAQYFEMLKVSGANAYLLTELRPNAAVLDVGSPLIWHLISEQKWHRIMTDGHYVLIAAPTLNLRH
ncbi:MAG TPA: hypothetical protein VMV52_07325 [Candidatus Nanopelagicaceae bacterium]|nr:hypothetical protein [Candidatus Nanopelagicaceae bacterium]